MAGSFYADVQLQSAAEVLGRSDRWSGSDGDRVLFVAQGGKRHDHHSSGGQGMDRNAFDAADADVLCFFHPRFAAAGVGVQDQYLEGDRAFRNLRPGDGLCGQ